MAGIGHGTGDTPGRLPTALGPPMRRWSKRQADTLRHPFDVPRGDREGIRAAGFFPGRGRVHGVGRCAGVEHRERRQEHRHRRVMWLRTGTVLLPGGRTAALRAGRAARAWAPRVSARRPDRAASDRCPGIRAGPGRGSGGRRAGALPRQAQGSALSRRAGEKPGVAGDEVDGGLPLEHDCRNGTRRRCASTASRYRPATDRVHPGRQFGRRAGGDANLRSEDRHFLSAHCSRPALRKGAD